MGEPQEYQEQARRARDELDVLLRMTRPDLPAVPLRQALGELNRWIEGWDTPPVRDVLDAHRARRDVWLGLPRPGRHRAVIEALGDRVLPLADLAGRVDALRDDWHVSRDDVQATLYELLEAGEVLRERRPVGARVRWHYFRPPVSAELADLQRRLEEADDAA